MIRIICKILVVVFLLSILTCKEKPREPVKPKKTRKDELIEKHRKMFAEVGISEKTREEMIKIVARVFDALMKFKKENPEKWKELEGKHLRQMPKTKDEFLRRHKRRFDAVGLSKEAQEELLNKILPDLWDKLKDPRRTDPAALKVREMMKKLPACCDEIIFKKAGMKPPHEFPGSKK